MAAFALALFADLPCCAIATGQTSFARDVLAITTLVVLTVAVRAASHTALAFVTDLAFVALGVGRTFATKIVFANLAAFAFFEIAAISGTACPTEAKLTIQAVAISGTSDTFALFADLATRTVTDLLAFTGLAGSFHTKLACPTTLIVLATNTLVVFAKPTFFAIAVVQAFFADASCGIADSLLALAIIDAFDALECFLTANLAFGARFVGSTSCAALARKADLST